MRASKSAAVADGEREYAPVPAACRILGFGRTMLYAKIKAGKIIARKVDGRTLIDMRSGRAFLAQCPRLGE